MLANAAIRRSPLHDRHEVAGARLIPFAGWMMPLQYGGIQVEHGAVREAAGLFDVSHMGQICSRGPGAVDFLQRVLSNDIARVPVGAAQYALICREDGGVLDDVFTYRLGEQEFLTVTNCANHARDLDWMRWRSRGYDLEVADEAAEYAMLALQGPAARALAAPLADGELPARLTCTELQLAGMPALVCGTGYTGEDGLELLLAPGDVGPVWDALLDAGAVPSGLGARDTLRLEACFHLYGNELSEQRDPITSGLGWCCKEETDFIGSERTAAVRAAGPAEKLVAFTMPEGIPRPGNPVVGGGVVTSGTFSPSLGTGIGMAFVPTGRSDPGTPIEIDVRGRVRPAEIVPKPLYSREEK